jgi:hypothetical protein
MWMVRLVAGQQRWNEPWLDPVYRPTPAVVGLCQHAQSVLMSGSALAAAAHIAFTKRWKDL